MTAGIGHENRLEKLLVSPFLHMYMKGLWCIHILPTANYFIREPLLYRNYQLLAISPSQIKTAQSYTLSGLLIPFCIFQEKCSIVSDVIGLFLVRLEGFELSTPGSGDQCSIH